jgi:hypothetical protein
MILKQLIRYTNAPTLEATWVDAAGVVIKCHAYAANQMDMLKSDLGAADAAANDALITQCAADYVVPVVVPPPIPTDVSMAQARLALSRAGHLDAASAAIANMTGQPGIEARIAWEFQTRVKRNDPLVVQLAPALSLTSADIDNLFTLAATL